MMNTDNLNMRKHKVYDPEELRYLRMLSRQYPTLRAAGTEIINLQAILNLLPILLGQMFVPLLLVWHFADLLSGDPSPD